MVLTARHRRLLALCVAALLGAATVVILVDGGAGDSQRQLFAAARASLASQVAQASAQGYTAEDIQPVTVLARQVESRPEPVWVGDRAAFYRAQTADETSLEARLGEVRTALLDQARQADQARLEEAAAKIAEDQKLGTDAPDLKTLQDSYAKAVGARASGQTLADLRNATRSAEAVATAAADVGAAQKVELAALQQSADQLQVQGLDALQRTGKDAVGSARNDATVGTWLKESGFDRAYRLLEKYAPLVSAGDIGQAALGTAGVQRYGQQIHDALVKGMPAKAIVISMQGQELRAFAAGRQVADTLVTTGHPPDLATDMGPMKVLWKQSPWKMHSPWPKESPYWYPDALVQKVVWFTNTGEGLHDASWQPAGTYGPGSQFGASGSHGCIHVPVPTETFLYDWADYGTPVIVYPGDGSPLAGQLAQKTTDDQGNPLTGPKGA